MTATYVFVAWILIRMLSSVYAQDKLQWPARDEDLLTDSGGITSEYRQQDIKSRYPIFSNYLHARAGTHTTGSTRRERRKPDIIHQSRSTQTDSWKRSGGEQRFYPSAAYSIGSDELYRAKRSRMGCDITQMTVQNIVEYLRRGRVCGVKAAQLRFGMGGKK